MKFIETRLPGAYLIMPEPIMDERGFFARTFCQQELTQYGINFQTVQCNISQNKKQGTLRGMHYQIAPYAEAKLVSCIQGAIYDVMLDLRPTSPTYCHWFSVELTPENLTMLYIPTGFAHGYQTLQDNTVVFYHVSACYHPASARGVRWNDPRFRITWPEAAQRILSEKDQTWADFTVSNKDLAA